MEAWIATLYEAAADDRLWPAALQAVERYAQAEGSGVMVFQGQEVVGARASGVLREVDDTIAANFTAPGDWRDNAGPAFCLRQPSSQFLNFDDYFSPALQSDDSGLRLIRQKRLSNQAGTILPMADGIAIVGICRAIEREPFSAAELAHLDRTRPHWAHAMQLAMYLERDRGRRVSQVLQDLNQPAAVLTTHGAVMVCNALFEHGLTDWAVLDAHDRVRPHAGVVAAYLAAALARPGDASTLPLTVATRSGQRLQLHLVPLVTQGRRACQSTFADKSPSRRRCSLGSTPNG